MSTQENPLQETEFDSEQAITIQPSGIAPYAGAADWQAGGETDLAHGGALGLDTVLHSLRRHWLVMFTTGIAASAVAATAVWFADKPKYEAEAVLYLYPAERVVLHNPGGDENAGVADEFNIFRNTQAALLKGRPVFQAALRNQKMKNLASIIREDNRHRVYPWLTSVVQVTPEKNSGIMRVTVTLPDANEAATIVNAVVSAYMDEEVNHDRDKRRERLDSLNTVAVQKEDEVRKLREDLKREMEGLGAGDDQSVSVRNQIAVQICAEYQRELQKMRFDHTSLMGKRQEDSLLLKAIVDRPDDYKVSEAEIAMVLANNPVYHDALPRQQMLRNFVNAGKKAITPTSKRSPSFAQAEAQLEATEDSIKQLRADATTQFRDAKRVELDREINRLGTEIDISTDQVTNFEKEVANKVHDADSVGRSTVSMQMNHAKLESVERILKGVSEEQARLKVELDNFRPRVIVPGSDQNAPAAAVPEEETGMVYRYLLIAASGLIGLCLPAACVVVWDVRKQRVNTPHDVSKKLKISVMGTLPLIPPTIMRKLGQASRRSQMWRLRYTEAVDGVVARLLRNAECDQSRVILVTSASSGEGKTWLATQLAMGLARAQRRTVLVDFDLRQPALDGALGLPLGPGVCEALRGQGEITQMVQPTDTEFFSVVTAGSWNRQVLPALANGSIAPMLAQLRESFDFVIIDSSPLLPIVDARLLCQHVDAVLLSVLRDVSEGDKVLAAQEMLDAFGVAHVDAVVTSGEQLGSHKSLLNHAALLDEHHARLGDVQSAPPPEEMAAAQGSGQADG